MSLFTNVSIIASGMPRELRTPVMNAVYTASGSMAQFVNELQSAKYEYPDLDVQLVLDKLAAINA